jgi:hypothetical protein
VTLRRFPALLFSAVLALLACQTAPPSRRAGQDAAEARRGDVLARPAPEPARRVPSSDGPEAAGIVRPEVGDRLRPPENGWFACTSQKLVLAAWFAQLAHHAGATRALFANEGDDVDCVRLRRDDPSVASILVVAAADDRLGAATIRQLTVRIFFADTAGQPRGSVEMFALGGVAGGFEVRP